MSILYAGFLYFPEDKSSYIPAALEFLAIFILCVFVFRLVKRLSKKEEQKTKALEEYVLTKQQGTQDKDTQLRK
ncbi:hypothetical protein [Ureibacillus chungkukjangi]|uniref:Uncharacterized protein n=1 Tax=Ureibacillus chungkukjangi TaxID=1202712 RepID=A0A318TG82_9BACL|nr:hypothetical protein [Ureibacillus chungkukjangi]MCM3388208.1 hypothetical protein [Ureibacillus chungkukjangi]PYF03716.1 hypothetical protein BJ095_12819 [Ureibacillus chungkukjangi]